jgi:hypothetical protein
MNIHHRIARRIRRSLPVAFVGLYEDLEGDMETLDISFTGCRAICQSPPPIGTRLQISLYLPGLEQSLYIEMAVVRWVRKAIIGIQFCAIQPTHRERLEDWILKAPYGRSEDAVATLFTAIQQRRILSRNVTQRLAINSSLSRPSPQGLVSAACSILGDHEAAS